MLHLITYAPIDLALFQRIAQGDDVIFLENAVFCINQGHHLTVELEKLIANQVSLFVLSEELETRGLDINRLVSGVQVINYADFVQLTEKNTVIKSWN